MNRITFVYSYFDNPCMLREQMGIWKSYPREVRQGLEVIITDDVSIQTPAKDIVSECIKDNQLFKIQVFNIKKKVPWNWLTCRNIGARYALHKWLLITDIDHAVPVETVQYLMENTFDEKEVYLFERQDMPDRQLVKPHDDSYFMARDQFWFIGGYDERLAGYYGTSGSYRKRVMNKVYGVKIEGGMDNLTDSTFPRLPVPLVRYHPEQILDASCSIPKQRWNKGVYDGGKLRLDDHYAVLSFPYEKTL